MIETSLEQRDMGSAPTASGRPDSGPAMRNTRLAVGYGLATALMLISPLLVFAPAALFQCGLRNGRRVAWGAFTVAVVFTALYFTQVASVSDAGAATHMAYATLAAVVLSIAIPSMAAMPMVERTQPFGTVLMFALTGSAVGLGLTELVMRTFAGFSPYGIAAAQIQQEMTRWIAFYRENGATQEIIRSMEMWSTMAMPILPASMLMQFSLVFILSLLMVGRLTAWRAFAADRTVLEGADRPYLFRNLSFPDWLLFGFVFGGLTPIASGTLQVVAANVLAVVVFLFLLQGLAVFRFMVAKAGAGAIGT
ncbi:MAG TPA: DUF2232 domain-containing protein, partial [Thermoanaerobaculia bacterium]